MGGSHLTEELTGFALYIYCWLGLTNEKQLNINNIFKYRLMIGWKSTSGAISGLSKKLIKHHNKGMLCFKHSWSGINGLKCDSKYGGNYYGIMSFEPDFVQTP